MTSAGGWRDEVSIEDRPVAAASIGQVHRGVAADGRTVAVKLQYPGADRALRSDLRQIARLARVATTWMPAIDIKPVTDELLAAADEELDYGLEAANQRAFAEAYRDDPFVAVPDVVLQTRHVLVDEWVDGASLGQVIRDGDQDVRDRVGQLYLEFLLEGPGRVGLLHADPHPGNFRLTPDGRLGVIDYGAVARLPDGIPDVVGRLVRRALDGDAQGVPRRAARRGFRPARHRGRRPRGARVRPPLRRAAARARARLHPRVDAGAARGVTDLRAPEFATGLRLNMPREYAMIHRVFVGATGVLSQLEATIPARASMERHLPGFADA
ncbi:AarF/ABC1/UbiB kinase family protein [Janibacter hoylei]|uniref:ABC1 kinase family protein n=1 Tax=Janibacter hoylei TaxID=364298 RepID=UPI00223899FD|nr:AarF/ABC1/UbiB kinase family protein [Janibacter hoylei]MCW4602491.1 AarF/ABC1/UbiB kinase family protein [Janibacter hoylei]